MENVPIAQTWAVEREQAEITGEEMPEEEIGFTGTLAEGFDAEALAAMEADCYIMPWEEELVQKPPSEEVEVTPTEPPSEDEEVTPEDPPIEDGETAPQDPPMEDGEAAPQDPPIEDGETAPQDPPMEDGETAPEAEVLALQAEPVPQTTPEDLSEHMELKKQLVYINGKLYQGGSIEIAAGSSFYYEIEWAMKDHDKGDFGHKAPQINDGDYFEKHFFRYRGC